MDTKTKLPATDPFGATVSGLNTEELADVIGDALDASKKSARPSGPMSEAASRPISDPGSLNPFLNTRTRDAMVNAGPARLPVDLDEAALKKRLSLDGSERYLRQEVLGSGGMGEVRLFRDQRIGREVAYKTMHVAGTSQKARQRFLREARVQGQLDHPSVVPVYDLGAAADGQLYFTMRRVNGHTLREILIGLAVGDKALAATYTRRKLLTAFASVCLTLHYAHCRGIIHRDLKPDNIMLGEYGEVYVLDWGIARVLDPATGDTGQAPSQAAVLTPPGGLLGTPAYMAPEQVKAQTESQDARTDVYALGVILYELLTHRPLFRARPVYEMAKAVLAGADARASLLVADVAPELDAICTRATAPDRVARFQSARELADAVEHHLDGDRDLERRRALVGELVASAKRRLEAVPADIDVQQDVLQYEASRELAIRDVTRALALLPDEPDARNLLVRLMLEEPRQDPPAVEADVLRAQEDLRKTGLRLGLLAMSTWLATLPAIVFMGVRSWRAVGAAMVLALASPLYAFMVRHAQKVARHMMVLMALVAALVSALSVWLGPFILGPICGVTSTMWFAMHASTKRELRIITLLGAAAVLAPFLLEYLGVVPQSHLYVDGKLLILPRGMHLPPLATELALIYTSVSFVVVASVATSGLRETLRQAERKNFLQAWRLKQLVPDDTREK